MKEEKFTVKTCSICKHKDRQAIEDLILANIRTQRSIAKEFNVHEASLSNHKNKHMLTSNMRERLKIIIQKSIMDGMEPDNISELLRLMDYVERMESESYLDGKAQWDESFNKKFKCFENTLDTYFTDLSDETKRMLLVSVKSAFGDEPKRDIGPYIASMLRLKEDV